MTAKPCVHCGEPLEHGWDTCPACASDVTDDDTCQSCGKTLKPTWKLCPFCKTARSSAQGSGSPTPDGGISGSPQQGFGGLPSPGSPLLTEQPGVGGDNLAMSAQPELEPGTELMHFRIESLLGKGASSAVYKAHHTLLDEAVALKMVAAFGSDHPLLGAYRDEYKAQLGVKNKHVLHIEAPLLCAHQNLNWLMLPMELAHQSLRDWMKRHPGDEKRLEQGLELFRQACLGVQAIHEAGLVHLDLKPENLLITGNEENPIVKVADFGLTRSMMSRDQRGGLFGDGIGTPAYMAPEQILAARWKDVGKEADIYALGMILYELLDGDLPYSGSAEQIKQKKQNSNIAITPPQGPQPLGEAAMACLQRDKANRPKSAKELMGLVEQKYKLTQEQHKNRQKAKELLGRAEQELKRGEIAQAQGMLQQAQELDPGNEAITQLFEKVNAQISIEEELKEKRKKQLIGEMVFVKGGNFRMGFEDWASDEMPVHKVKLEDFYIGKYPVTQAQWKAVMDGKNPSFFKGENRPVEQVSWEDAQGFIRKLNELTGKTFRLPTEAEWEYAARGGQKSRGYRYAGSDNLHDVGWFEDNTQPVDRVSPRVSQIVFGGEEMSGSVEFDLFGVNSKSGTQSVGLKKPNELGIYDISGNVWEWCSDWYDSGYYKKSPYRNPKGPTSGKNRLRRGGSWNSGLGGCRCSFRNYYAPGSGSYDLGFRLVCSSG